MDLVLDQRDLIEPVARAAEDARNLAVDEHDRVASRRLHLDERLDVGGVVDHDAVAHRARQLDRLEQVVRPAGEHGDAVGALEVERLQVPAQPLHVLADRRALRAGVPIGLVEQRVDRRAARLRARELRRIEVEIETDDLASRGTKLGQAAERVGGELVRLHMAEATPSARFQS